MQKRQATTNYSVLSAIEETLKEACGNNKNKWGVVCNKFWKKKCGEKIKKGEMVNCPLALIRLAITKARKTQKKRLDNKVSQQLQFEWGLGQVEPSEF